MTAPSSTPLEIDVRQLHALRQVGADLVLVDCREAEEFEFVHLSDARFLPLSAWEERLGDLHDVQARPLVIYCHHGGRSLRLALALRQRGFPQAQSLAGGIDQWSETIDPNLPRY